MPNPDTNSNPRKGRGRQKIEMKKITRERNLLVTFCKRRSGLFKKASELSTLCGAQVAIIMFSPTDKAFTFGHPNVNAVIDQFQMRGPPPPYHPRTIQFIEAHRNAVMRELNSHLTQINAELETQKRYGEALNMYLKEAREKFWWASPIEDMSNTELDQFQAALENMKKSIMENAPSNPTPLFHAGGSSSSNPLHHQPPSAPPPSPQWFFPVHPSQSQMQQQQQNSSPMLPNNMLGGGAMNMMMHQPNLNNMGGGFGPPSGFF
ncbi:hypothetical protein RIF29_22682 [Crotalaria pallida]|uniref:MADS-box domain-containing protein n=1 Tax=Crotalaria pallida TaxID=3830 RepID=A0AAN9IEM6_CROPI